MFFRKNTSTPNRHIFGGFSLENYFRNEGLKEQGMVLPAAVTTGTTVVGVQFDQGVIIASDTRETMDDLITEDDVSKIRPLQDNIYCGGSGYGSDLDSVARLINVKLEMHSRNTRNRTVPVCCAKQMAKEFLMNHWGFIMLSLILGGVDNQGSHLYTVHFDGTTERCQFNSIGSGQFGAMGILEHRWKPGLNEDDARELALDAVAAGINNDLASGSSVDLIVIRNDFTVERCGEVLHKHTRDRRVPLDDISEHPDNLPFNVYGNPEILRTVVRPNVFTKYNAPLQTKSKSLPRLPIRRNQVRQTEAKTELVRKRSATHADNGEPPAKKRKKPSKR